MIPIATAAQIEITPIGDSFHRAWECKTTQPDRIKHSSYTDRATTREGWGRGDVGWERALVCLPPRPQWSYAPEATFHWEVEPTEAMFGGRFYLDGSALDGPSMELMRCGWSFVAVNARGQTIAAAYGATPPWITDIGGAEAWALLQATGSALPGESTFISDCKVMVDCLKDGKRKATAGSSTHARVYALIFSAIDDTPLERIIWMPAHQGKKAIGKRRKSDGTYLTKEDVEFNDAADYLAKKGVEDHRVPFKVREAWRRCLEEVKSRAMWIGRVNSLANNLPVPPFSDSCSSRAIAEKSKRAKTRAKLASLLGKLLNLR